MYWIPTLKEFIESLEIESTTSTTTISLLSHENNLDYATLTTTTNGATTLSTVDASHASAHFEIEADGDITLDSAGQIKLEPVAGSNILLDGILTVDAGAVIPVATAHDTAGTDISIVSGATTADASTKTGDVYIGTDQPAHDLTAAAETTDEGTGGIVVDSVVFPKGITIYGRWTEIDVNTGSVIAYIGE